MSYSVIIPSRTPANLAQSASSIESNCEARLIVVDDFEAPDALVPSTKGPEEPANGAAAAVTVEEISFDFSKLTGHHVIRAEGAALIARAGQPVMVLRLDVEFQIQLAAEACGIDAAILHNLGPRDFLLVAEVASGFLFGTD